MQSFTPEPLEMISALPKLIEAYKKGTLGALTGQTECEYAYPNGSHCAIGCMLSEETIERLADHGDLRIGLNRLLYLPPKGDDPADPVYITLVDPSEVTDFKKLQALHDWVCSHNDTLTKQGADPGTLQAHISAMNAFYEGIKIMAEKYHVPCDI